ncbi:unnamed protein product (macronuclear) [Paramecium tetraurelia]|uniref:Calmodulin-lysine N-methyltransferase n=1 Tax=Paramecium tetraurelia TaxID=5888 RepID=A0BKZ3_PARTE|nr:uncharacterized protein GSPATT00029841001 [Paramecium tetraurelia]CAK59210.1 unnamed protein product [Paramecium tetraurelia]|eukprot:XP_001426608.1 hypothetical protein (macronuclear) [Paramecium tetraurelia strain d4-2]
MKGQKLWKKLKGYLLENQDYKPDINDVQIFKKEIKDDIIIYQVEDVIVKQSNKQLLPDKSQLNQVNENDIDNTGVFYWPSEIILTKYILGDLDRIKNYNIVELGAGRSGFCGLVLAKKGFNVILTDGNQSIINELKENVILNELNLQVEALKWQSGDPYANTCALISDCFFFENYHNDLIQMIKRFCFAIGAAPSRGGSLERFINKCQNQNIECKQLNILHDTQIILFNVIN